VETNLAVVSVRVALLLDSNMLGVMVTVEVSKARSRAEETTGSAEYEVIRVIFWTSDQIRTQNFSVE
jgi:hypothetical protein